MPDVQRDQPGRSAEPGDADRISRLLRRRRGRRTRWSLAARSRGALSVRQLRAFERGTEVPDGALLPILAEVYGFDGCELYPDRTPLEVDLELGTVAAGRASRSFEPHEPAGLLVAYLALVRDLRGEPHALTLALRRDDIEVLAAALELDGPVVVERLGALMGSTALQQRVAAAAFTLGRPAIVLPG